MTKIQWVKQNNIYFIKLYKNKMSILVNNLLKLKILINNTD